MIKVPSNNLVIEDAEITYRNFAGVGSQYNAPGARNFAVKIFTLEQAQALEELGWKVKYTKVREDGSENEFPAYLPVHIKYHPQVAPPKIKMVVPSRNIQTALDEEAIDVIDYVDIAKCDLILRPFKWRMPNGSEGIKNMLFSIYVTIKEDELELKYANVPTLTRGDEQKALESPDDWGNGLEDMGEIAANRHALEQGRGF